jgi:type II restriction/modification system DNA methylase subunit YeeA
MNKAKLKTYAPQARKDFIKVVRSEDIPAATQLFTPNWIVQYLVQNSIGRLWLMANPASTLKNDWPYYIEPAEQTPEVQAQLDALIQTRLSENSPRPEGEGPGVRGTLNPETITVLDPACGSGHILVEAYEVLKAIYLERGYQPRSIPRLILENNLYGLDIDDRAAQLAGFALLMKARADDRRLLDNPPKLNVLSLQESKGLGVDELAQALSGYAALSRPTIASLLDTFVHAKTFGSLIQIPAELNAQLSAMDDAFQQAIQSGDLFTQAAAFDLLSLVRQARILGMQFDAVVANPPYMGGKYLTPQLKNYLKENYKGFEKDLFSAFMIRDLSLTKESGQLGFMSPFVWMFISSYEELRKHFIDNATLTSLIQLEYSGFDGATVPICTFTLSKAHVSGLNGSYIRLSDFRGADQQGPKTLEAIQNPDCGWFYIAKPDDFKKIPGRPVAYWVNREIFKIYTNTNTLENEAPVKSGMSTTNNSRFLRLWFEIDFYKFKSDTHSLQEAQESKKKWFPYKKGGEYRKWAGNDDYVVNWYNNGEEIKHSVVNNPSDPNTTHWSRRIFGVPFFFKKSLTYSRISSSNFSVRYSEFGSIFSDASNGCFPEHNHLMYLAFLNSSVASYFLSFLSPTLNFMAGDVQKLPSPIGMVRNENYLSSIQLAIDISQQDWDSNETSWGFKRNSLCRYDDSKRIQDTWCKWGNITEQMFHKMKSLEEENNRVFIEAYGLQDELSPDVPEEQITLARADREKDCQRLISYAIGCMMGRYSIDEPSLIYAHAGNVDFDPTRYSTFPADADGIVPITDELWFEDDAANRIREFLLAVWGAETLDENLAWLAESLGQKANETPEETIRRYLAGSFFKDHLQTYKKRPIYWLFSSGKQGAFQALVYLHRYHEGTLARMRAEYVVPLTGKIQSRIEMLKKDADAAASNAARNKLNKDIEKLNKKHVELLAYDEKLRHYADRRIQLDLDDGVKVNYGKFGDLLAEVKAVTGGDSDD